MVLIIFILINLKNNPLLFIKEYDWKLIKNKFHASLPIFTCSSVEIWKSTLLRSVEIKTPLLFTKEYYWKLIAFLFYLKDVDNQGFTE